MKNNKFFSMDGEVLSYDAVAATQNIGGLYNEDYHTDYFNAQGEEADDFYDGKIEKFDNFFGKRFRENQAKRQRRRDLREQSKAKARETKAKSQLEQAKSQTAAARASEKAVAGDIAMAEALKSSAPVTETTKKGLSMGAKIGIGVGAVVVVGIIGFVILKSMKKAS